MWLWLLQTLVFGFMQYRDKSCYKDSTHLLVSLNRVLIPAVGVSGTNRISNLIPLLRAVTSAALTGLALTLSRWRNNLIILVVMPVLALLLLRLLDVPLILI